MTAKRNGDTLIMTITGEELAEFLNNQSVRDTITEALDADEHLIAWAFRRTPPGLTLTIDLDIIAAPGQSEREIYLRENGVPLV